VGCVEVVDPAGATTATACVVVPISGGACDDGDPLTQGDSCVQGACKPGTFVGFCKDDADCVKYEDGDLCNGTLFCLVSAGTCEVNPATALV
jgi:hypothetical protein